MLFRNKYVLTSLGAACYSVRKGGVGIQKRAVEGDLIPLHVLIAITFSEVELHGSVNSDLVAAVIIYVALDKKLHLSSYVYKDLGVIVGVIGFTPEFAWNMTFDVQQRDSRLLYYFCVHSYLPLKY